MEVLDILRGEVFGVLDGRRYLYYHILSVGLATAWCWRLLKVRNGIAMIGPLPTDIVSFC